MASQLRVDKILPVDGAPTGGGGGIVQIKQVYKIDEFTSESASFVDVTGMQVSITPKFNTSKILITANIGCAAEAWNYGACLLKVVYASDNTNYADIGLPTSGTKDCHMAQNLYANDNSNTQRNFTHVNWCYLHSPATTNQIGYKLQGRIENTGTWWVNRSAAEWNTPSSITLMEVSA